MKSLTTIYKCQHNKVNNIQDKFKKEVGYKLKPQND